MTKSKMILLKRIFLNPFLKLIFCYLNNYLNNHLQNHLQKVTRPSANDEQKPLIILTIIFLPKSTPLWNLIFQFAKG